MFIIKLGDNDMAKNTKGFFKMEMLLLKIISEGDCYGYQIVQTLDKISNGTRFKSGGDRICSATHSCYCLRH